MLKNLPVILLILVVVYVLYSSQLGATVQDAISDLTGNTQAENAGAPGLDLGMYDAPNPNAFGTTLEGDRRITNDGVRKEYHQKSYCANHGQNTFWKRFKPDKRSFFCEND